jgi:hypothetical protein
LNKQHVAGVIHGNGGAEVIGQPVRTLHGVSKINLSGVWLHQYVRQLPKLKERKRCNIHHAIDYDDELLKPDFGTKNGSALQVASGKSNETSVAWAAGQNATEIDKVNPVPILPERNLRRVEAGILTQKKCSVVIE